MKSNREARAECNAAQRPVGLPTATAIAVIFAAAVWAYWPVLVALERTWSRQPDYSHGYMVIPLAGCFLWARRTLLPPTAESPAYGGLTLLLAALGLRIAGAAWYLPSVEGWSLPLCAAGAVWFLAGSAALRWSLPAIAFLGFMLPLPYRLETLLSLPLQHVAARASCWMLECLGEPATNEGHVIVIRDARLLVAEACNGMRIFISVLALGYAYTALSRRRWWCKLCLLLSVLPIAVVVNSLRITVTALLHSHVASETAHRFAHDVSGWAMLPVAALLLAFVPWYLSRLVVEVETASPPDLLSQALAAPGHAR